MSNADVGVGATETQQLRVIAPPGVSIVMYSLSTRQLIDSQSNVRLRLRISYAMDGNQVQDQVDFSGFPPSLTGGAQ
jgi:AP-1 complex subunit gamma-1